MSTVHGQCWHAMFANQVMVVGFPTLEKHESDIGLEMPLNMMALTAETKRATTFDGKLFIKGFSTMLIATRIVRDLILWHYYYNTEGKRISHFDHNHQNIENISLHQLHGARNVVGWCADIEYLAGQLFQRILICSEIAHKARLQNLD
jgi:hypothetical protein